MRIWLVLLILLASFSAHTKTLVISDIDDTLKNSHVLDIDEAIKKAVFTDDYFLGMNLVLRELRTADERVQFEYVSSAPSDIMLSFHSAFLEMNGFPEGNLQLNEGYFSGTFKVDRIREIIRRYKPDLVINIGDNGEKDSFVYDQIRREFPEIRFLTFIHISYFSKARKKEGKSLLPGQIGFATSWDLMLQLHLRKLIDRTQLQEFFEDFAPAYLVEKERKTYPRMAIPKWSDCRDFSWSMDDSLFFDLENYVKVKEKIQKRCSRRAFGDD